MHTKKEAAILFAIMAVLILAISYSGAQASTPAANVSNATVDSPHDPVTIVLAKDKYVQGAAFQGSVKFYFDKPIDTSTVVNVKMFGKSKELTIEHLL